MSNEKRAVEIAHAGGDGTVTVILHDGSKVEIRRGREKRLIVRRDGKFHLLDCTCALCRPVEP